ISFLFANVVTRSAARNANAWIVAVGWLRPLVTRLEPSQINRFCTSCERWSALMTDFLGSFPIRHVPSNCSQKSRVSNGISHRCALGHTSRDLVVYGKVLDRGVHVPGFESRGGGPGSAPPTSLPNRTSGTCPPTRSNSPGRSGTASISTSTAGAASPHHSRTRAPPSPFAAVRAFACRSILLL